MDLAAARAKRALPTAEQLSEFDAQLDAAFEADLALEQKLGRERLSPEALGELRRDLIRAMTSDGAELGARASVLHSVLYAMVRELLDQRADSACVRGAWRAYQNRAIGRGEFEQDILCVAECSSNLDDREIIDSLGVVLGGGA